MSGQTLDAAVQQPFEMPQEPSIAERLPQLFATSHSIRIMEVAKKYLAEQVRDSLTFSSPVLKWQGDEITHMPFYTRPSGPNTYHLAPSACFAST